MNLMARRAFIIVDMQKDFLPGGSLAVPGGDEIIDPIIAWADRTHHKSGIVIATRDYHPKNHISFSDDPQFTDYSWPPHCVQGTPGVKIHRKIKAVADFIVSKGDDPNLEAYSAFDGYTLRPKMKLNDLLRDQDVDAVEVAGLAFDKCVGQTALDANALGWYTTVLCELTRPINREGELSMFHKLQKAEVGI